LNAAHGAASLMSVEEPTASPKRQLAASTPVASTPVLVA